MRRFLVTVCCALALNGCALMTAPAPLFEAEDQPGEILIEPGMWALLDGACRPDRAKGRSACPRVRVSLGSDGALRLDPIDPENPQERWRVVLIAAARSGAGEGRPALLLAEAQKNEDPEAFYAIVVPRGDQRPARRVWVHAIACDAALAAGPLADFRVHKHDAGQISACAPTTKAAALEAARRALLAEIDKIGEQEMRWIAN